MRSRRSPGFSLVELLVSVAILGILASTSWVSLSRLYEQNQLYTAARALASDLRSAQAEAFNSVNVSFCDNPGSPKNVCTLNGVANTAQCVVPKTCSNLTPAAVGVQLTAGATTYNFYAKYDVSSGDSCSRGATEQIVTRSFTNEGAPHVRVLSFSSTTAGAVVNPENVAFLRQNGTMQINACAGHTPGADLTVTLQNTVTARTLTVTLNAVTGRISTQE